MDNDPPANTSGRIVLMRRLILLCLLGLILAISACADGTNPSTSTVTGPITVSVDVDGTTTSYQTESSNVREFLETVDVAFEPRDEISPPLFTPLTDNLAIVIVRITEQTALIEQSVPFARKIVRNESMSADDPPRIIQSGVPGLQELTVRIVFRDGIEFERQTINLTTITEAEDEIIMIGVGSAPGNTLFPGSIAYISSGRALILRGNTAFPEQIELNGIPDGRVFSLSPTGEFLLYTLSDEQGEDFNSLWVVSTQSRATPISLDVFNILWADWNPATISEPEIAYSTAIPTDLAPGWEANNDLWVGQIDLDLLSVVAAEDAELLESEQIVESYPAKLGWWGGKYSWSPTGRYIAYSYADEVGILDLNSPGETPQRTQLFSFVEFDTLSDWVWVPSVSWSPDGRYLVYSTHRGPDTQSSSFDTWAVDVSNGVTGRFATETGIWSHPFWSTNDSNSQIAFLRTTDPINSLRSTYTLWLMDSDGSNGRQLYPPAGENSLFPRDQAFMTWGPTGEDIAFIFNNSLYLFNIISDELFRITQDETNLSQPSWAPYGAGIGRDSAPVTNIVPVEEVEEEIENSNEQQPLPLE